MILHLEVDPGRANGSARMKKHILEELRKDIASFRGELKEEFMEIPTFQGQKAYHRINSAHTTFQNKGHKRLRKLRVGASRVRALTWYMGWGLV